MVHTSHATFAVLSFVLPTEKVLATFVEETYGQRLEAAFSARRSFRRKIRKMADKEVGLPDKKLLKTAKREKKRQEKAKAERDAAKDEEKVEDEEDEVTDIDGGEGEDRKAEDAEEKRKK